MGRVNAQSVSFPSTVYPPPSQHSLSGLERSRVRAWCCVFTGWQCSVGEASDLLHMAQPSVFSSLAMFPCKECKRAHTKATLSVIVKSILFFLALPSGSLT